MNIEETAELLARVSDAYQARAPKPAPSVLAMWARMLADLDAADAQLALDEHVASSPHPPTIADIRSRAIARRIGLPDVAAAWEEVTRAIQRCGRDHEPKWSHPAIERAVGAMGWRELCNTTEDNLPTVRAQWRGFFLATGETLARRENVGALEAHGKRLGGTSAGDALKLLLEGKAKP